MAIDLSGKRILITGATDGLGRLTAVFLAKQGLSVTIHGRNQKKLTLVLDELTRVGPKGKHSTLCCDFNQPETVSEAFRAIGQLDILINNAGMWSEGATIDVDPNKIIELINVNLASYLLVTRTLLPVLKKAAIGQVLNVVSVAGYEIPFDYYHTAYTATKFALQGYSEALAKEFADSSIRAMAIYPGGMVTPLFRKAGEAYTDQETWMFDPQETVEALFFMLTRNQKVSVKRLDLINHLQEPPVLE